MGDREKIRAASGRAPAKERYHAEFERLEREAGRNGGLWLHPLRRSAIAAFADQGFPTTRHEEWKYTNVAPILDVAFAPAGHDGIEPEPPAGLSPARPEEIRLVFVNGFLAPGLSSSGSLPRGVMLGSLGSAAAGDGSGLRAHLARYASYRDHAFVALNTAFMRDGAFLHVPRGVALDSPVHFLFISEPDGAPTVSYPRNLVILEQASQAKVVETYAGQGGAYFTNAVTEIVAGENASLEHYKIQEERDDAFHIATIEARLERSSNFSSHSIALGAALARTDINVTLDGEGAVCSLNGLFLSAGERLVDNHTRIDHVRPHGTSRELYKGILDGGARGVFNGKIYVHKSAAKTDARQTNKNLLLSREALMDTKPQLEIHNNDVKCTHGSTIGQLDADALFYLRSRGMNLDGARSLLTYGFASEIVQQIRIGSLRVRLEEFLTGWLGKNGKGRENR